MGKYLFLFRDWRFVFKFVSFIIIGVLLLCGLIWGCFIDYWYVTPGQTTITVPRLYNFDVIMSFWSVHTNILILFWFFFALVYHNHEAQNKFTNFTSQTTITVYITITFLLFWGIIVGNILGISVYDFSTRTKSDIALTSLTHSLTPLLMIGYFLLSFGNQKVTYKTLFIKNLWIMMLYPIGYCIFLVLRAKLVTGDKIPDFVYPYDFLDFSRPLFGTSLALSNFVCIATLAILLIGFNLLYISTNNLQFKVKTKKHNLKAKRNDEIKQDLLRVKDSMNLKTESVIK